jgi:UDP-glucose 4-epimerase
MHVVVTGAGGFSGSHLVPALLNRGHSVTAIVGRARGRLDPGLQSSRLKVLSWDLSERLTQPDKADAIIHAAARSPGPGVAAADLVRANALGTLRLVEYAHAASVGTFIYLSSLSIYGRITVPVVDESTPIVDPDAYGMTKYLGEVTLRDTGRLRSLSIRLPAVLGRNSVRNWPTSVMTAAKAHTDIAYYNPDGRYNNAVHIDDLCRFTAALLDRPDWNGHSAVTIGADGMTTVRRAVQIIVERLNSRSKLQSRIEASPNFTVSSELAHGLGYRPMEIEALLGRFADENRDTG